MNPYTSRAMIRDGQFFFGRQRELQSLYTRLQNMQSCSLVGPRRMGKSSLLYHLIQPSVYAPVFPQDAERRVFAYLDLQELAGLGPDDFFYTAVERLKRAAQGRLAADLERDGTQAGFRRFLGRVTDDDLRLVLCCDEFEILSQNPHFDANFFSYLRALCSNYNLALLTSSRTSLFDLCHQGDLQSSQFWNIFVEQPLGLLAPDEARRLASEPFAAAGVVLSAAQIDFLLDLSGGHPFYLQIAAYHLFQALQAGDEPDLEQVGALFFDEACPHLTYAWDQLAEAEQAALARLGHTPDTALPEAVFRPLARQALLAGASDRPLLAGSVWRRFLTGLAPATLAPEAPAASQPVAASLPSHFKRANIQYLDFDLLFERAEDHYRARVLNSPSGQALADFRLPFSETELENFYLRIGQPRAHVRRVSSSEMEAARAFGGRLFDAVFKDDLYHCLHRSLDEAGRLAGGLRIRLRLGDTPELAELPWEYLYNSVANRFLALSVESPVVRYLELPERVRPLEVRPPLKILTMISSPTDYLNLDVEHEWRNLKDALTEPEQSGLVQIDRLEKATLSALLARLQAENYHIFHYIGHGGFDAQRQGGVLLLEDEARRGRPVGSQHLGMLLHDERMVLAVLNACEGGRAAHDDPFAGTAQTLVQQGIPAVVAMQFAITDRAAITFSNQFYLALSHGYPVDAALIEARKAIFAAGGDVEWGTPVLYLRSSDGHIFDFQ